MAEIADIFISAGEASGDHYGAELMRQIHAKSRDKFPKAAPSFFGLCGPSMLAEKCEPIVRAEEVAHMGITEVVRHAPFIYRQFQNLKASIADRKPALAVLIDFPDVNFRLAKQCKALGIPVLWLVSPQLWAWKKRRLRWVQQRVTKMLVIFPFEEAFYRKRGVDAEFIGHPLADLPLPSISREEFANKYGLNAAKSWIEMLPGSRSREFELHFHTMAEAARLLGAEFEYLVPIASTLDWKMFSRRVSEAPIRMVPVHDAREALWQARASVVASGTATVQAALLGNPFVIVYKMSPLSYKLARALVSVEFAGMPNLVAGREVVPELLQRDFTADKIVDRMRPLLEDSPQRHQMQTDLVEVRHRLTLANGHADPALPNLTVKDENGNSTAIARAADCALALLHASTEQKRL
jgi:lipid-A-disaccharide synthase